MSTSLSPAEEPAPWGFSGTSLAKEDQKWPGFHLSNWPCHSASSSHLIQGFILGFLRSQEQSGLSVFLSHNWLWESSWRSKKHVDFLFFPFRSPVVCPVASGRRLGVWGCFPDIIFLKIQCCNAAPSSWLNYVISRCDQWPSFLSDCPPWWETGPLASSYGYKWRRRWRSTSV